jgi:hypothetical protein
MLVERAIALLVQQQTLGSLVLYWLKRVQCKGSQQNV